MRFTATESKFCQVCFPLRNCQNKIMAEATNYSSGSFRLQGFSLRSALMWPDPNQGSKRLRLKTVHGHMTREASASRGETCAMEREEMLVGRALKILVLAPLKNKPNKQLIM